MSNKSSPLILLVLGVVAMALLGLISSSAYAGTITYVGITGDEDCGISDENIYTHKLDFGTGTPGALINGVQFDAYNNAATGTLNFNRTATSGTLNEHPGDAGHNVTGALADLLTDMLYNGNNEVGGTTTWTLSGLTPGQTYHTRIYSRPWGLSESRLVTFVFDPDGAGPVSDTSQKINQDNATSVGFANFNDAYYINYEFTAVAGENLVITLTQDIYNYSWHLYGLTNQEFSPETASLPSPVDGATDVPRDVVLSWTAGVGAATHNVYFGTSYDDVDAASAANPLGVLLGQGLTAASFQPPEILDFSTTYYWRVDEVEAAPSSAVHKGKVWAFTTEPFAYAIQGIIATSNTVSAENQGPENTVNGSGLNADDQHSVETTHMWGGTLPADESAYIQYEFDRVYKMHEMLVWNYNMQFEGWLGIGVKNTTVECSVDGVDWTTLGDFELAQGPGSPTYTADTVVPFDGVPAKFVRLTVNSTFLSTSMCGLSEVRFMYIPAHAREPKPADGAVNIAVDAVLSWRGGRDAATHKVYLDTEMATVDDGTALVDETTQTSYNPGGLNVAETYYWKVTEVNPADATPEWDSAIWTFSTQEYLTVDNFETYTDDYEAGEAIWQMWIDGWGDPANGSQVGYGASPFAEQTIIHGGRQSMPLAYDNSSAAMSEAVRTLSPAQKWSANGIKSLSLYFFGDPGNDAGQLYLKINGTEVLYEGSPDDLKIGTWLPWTVDLASTGANLQNVTTLTIGVKNAGPAGMLFVDDIRLYSYDSDTIDAVEPSTEGLVAYWPFDGDATDVAGGHNGTIAPGVEFTDGVVGQATDSSDLEDITVPYSADFALNTFTVAAWVNVSDLASPRGIIGTRFNGEYTFDLKVMQTMIHGDIGTGTAWINTAVDIDRARGGALETRTWHHIAYVINGEAGKAELYLDGALARTIAFQGLPLLMQEGQEMHLCNSYGTVEYMRGSVDELRIYNVALSQGEVAGLVGRSGPIYEGF